MSYNQSTLITKYFPLNTIQQQQIATLQHHYTHWNKKINLISRKDINNLYLHHVLHSLSIAKLISFNPQSHILDLGTGGGFPGIPLAILFPQAHFTLVDSIAKKIKAVQNIVQELKLQNITIHCTRAETLQQTYDFIIGRAVTNLTTLYHWVQDKIKKENTHNIPNGILYLKGDIEKNTTHPQNTQYTTHPIQHFFQEPFFSTKYIVHLFPTQT